MVDLGIDAAGRNGLVQRLGVDGGAQRVVTLTRLAATLSAAKKLPIW